MLMALRVVVLDGGHRLCGDGEIVDLANRWLSHLGSRSFSPQTVRGFEPTAGLDALAKFALDPLLPGTRPLNYLPARVQIAPMPEDAARTLVTALTELGVIVEIKDDFELASEFFAGLAAQMMGLNDIGGAPLIGASALMSVKGMTVERIAAFADAARSFWNAAPWRLFKGEVVWRIEPSPKTRPLKHCTVMGGGGEEFGLAFLADPMQMMAMAAADDPADYFANSVGTHWSVMFDPTEDAPRADVHFWQEHALPLAEPDAFPIPMGVTHTHRVQRPTPANLTLMEGLLRAFAPLTRAEIKTGRFAREFITFEGPRTLTLEAVMKM